ncbi:MAG: hypothetical protein Q4C67_01495 [Deinococcus sp.]|nr:hypothetical protein [Deinococcus sp.]
MLGQRRLPPKVLFLLSLLLGALAGAAAYRYASAENWLPAALWGAVAVWLVVDAVRALGWMKHGRTITPQPAAPQPQDTAMQNRMPAASVPTAASTDPSVTGAQVNPLLREAPSRPANQATQPVQPTDQLD